MGELDKELLERLASFKKANDKMIITNDSAYKSRYSFRQRVETCRDYTDEEIARIINSGSLVEQQKLSRDYFNKSGYYRSIILYYSTLLMYQGLLIPKVVTGKNLSSPYISKRYYSAQNFVDNMNLYNASINWCQKILTDGCYYGLRIDDNKNFSYIDLPPKYCASRFKDTKGNDLIEFDLSYFDTIIDDQQKKDTLETYPKTISKAYENYKKGKIKETYKWFVIPSELGICFPFFNGRPPFIHIIPYLEQYDELVATECEQSADEIRKILVQKMPHLSDGRLVFEPDEAQEMHTGAVGMLKGNKNISVLTTYADVDAIVSKTATDNSNATLDRVEKNVYAQGGVSGEMFASSGANALGFSSKKDLALMMYIANKISTYTTNLINLLFSNSNISFTYKMLPLSYQNQKDYLDQSFKLTGSGYSYILPVMALGLNGQDLVGLKDIENDILKLGDKLKPLQTAYTQTQTTTKTEEKSAGRDKLDDQEKSDQTIRNEQSIEKGGN